MKLIPTINRTKFNEHQEAKYRQVLDNNIKKYMWIILILVVFFQIYNIVYIGLYTNWTFNTLPSKIYTLFYSFMIIISILSIILILRCKKTGQRVVRIQYLFVVFLLVWSLMVTIYDNRVTNQINVYLISLMAIASFTYLPPKLFFPLYILGDGVLIGLLLLLHPDNFNSYVSLSLSSGAMSILALFISYSRYHFSRQLFLKDYLLEQKDNIINENKGRLDYDKYHDHQSKLLNRRYLKTYLTLLYQKNVTISKKTGVLIIDIDDFSNYNDYFGHVKGDTCILRIADALSLSIDSGFLIRYSGQQFIYIIENTTIDNLQFIGQQMNRAVAALNLTVPPNIATRYVTVSIGGSLGIIKDEKAWDNILNKANDALALAKRKGKNTCITN